jgi:hypothetical protein
MRQAPKDARRRMDRDNTRVLKFDGGKGEGEILWAFGVFATLRFAF